MFGLRVKSRACTSLHTPCKNAEQSHTCKDLFNGNTMKYIKLYWLVVGPPLWKIWVRQLEFEIPNINGKIKLMFNQTTNQQWNTSNSRFGHGNWKKTPYQQLLASLLPMAISSNTRLWWPETAPKLEKSEVGPWWILDASPTKSN